MKTAAVPKPRARKVTDPAQITEIVARGKYRPNLPHFQKDGDGLLLEQRDDLAVDGQAK